MGCLKLSYYYDERALNKRPVFSVVDKAKNASGSEICKDYYAGGMLMPGRSFNSNSYRFGMTGQEADDEITGTRSHYTSDSWEYDSRIIRRWNIDPRFREYPNQSPYACFNGNPIIYSDPTGKGGEYKVIRNESGQPIKVVISAQIFIYSDQEDIHQLNNIKEKLENSICNRLNESSGTVNVSTVQPLSGESTITENVPVEWNITVNVIENYSEAVDKMENNTSQANNFVYVANSEYGGGGVAVGNSIWLTTSATSKTFAEEFIHTLDPQYNGGGVGSHGDQSNSMVTGIAGGASKLTSLDYESLNASQGKQFTIGAADRKGSSRKFGTGISNKIFSGADNPNADSPKFSKDYVRKYPDKIK